MKQINLDKTFLYQEYLIKDNSVYQIAILLSCSPTCVKNNLLRYNICIKSKSDSMKGKNNPNYGKDLSGKNNPSWIDGRTLKKYYCIDCEEKLSGYQNERCWGCSCIYRGKNIKGKNHPHWIKDRESMEYGGEFNNQLKEQIRKRDNYKCQICGCSQLENGKALDVHHIDYDKKNNCPNNLITLCVSCHRKTNFNRKFWINYFKMYKRTKSLEEL